MSLQQLSVKVIVINNISLNGATQVVKELVWNAQLDTKFTWRDELGYAIHRTPTFSGPISLVTSDYRIFATSRDTRIIMRSNVDISNTRSISALIAYDEFPKKRCRAEYESGVRVAANERSPTLCFRRHCVKCGATAAVQLNSVCVNCGPVISL